MTSAPPPQGFFGLPDVGDIIDQAAKLLPGNVTDAIKDTVGKILDPKDDTINEGDPQPPGTPPIPVEPGTGPMAAVIKALDAINAAIDVVLKLSFLIPDQYEAPIRALQGALKTVRSWLD